MKPEQPFAILIVETCRLVRFHDKAEMLAAIGAATRNGRTVKAFAYHHGADVFRELEVST